MWTDEADPRPNSRSLVQVDAHSAHVARTRPPTSAGRAAGIIECAGN